MRPGARDPRFQAGMLAAFGVLAVTLDSLPALALLAAAGAGWAIAARPGAARLLLLAGAAGVAAWGLMFSQALFYASMPRTVLWVLAPPDAPLIGPLTGGVAVYAEGVLYGAVQSLRLVATLSAGMAAVWTTDPSRLPAGLAALRLPPALAFSAAAALRFLPVTAEEARTALRAQRMRGLRLGGRLGLNAARALLAVARPVLAASIRRAENVALASASRAYDPARPRTALAPLSMGATERAILWTVLLAAAAVAAAKALYLLYAMGLYYHPALAPLYTLTREVL